MSNLLLKDVRKSFGPLEVIHGIDLEIKSGELVVFVGPSGCGKSTLLRIIAGLEEATSGTIEIGDRVVNDVSPSDREIAMVFQSYALYPHMTVFQNMGFGLRNIGTPKPEIETRVHRAAEILQITPLLDRLPRSLSGGQRQRVAIGRAIVRDPQVFLFDEPLSNLDAALRVQTRLEIAQLHNKLKSTMVYVTHDQVEAMTLADKIVALNGGRIEQFGTPLELYDNPQNIFVAGFIGSPKMNFISAKIGHEGGRCFAKLSGENNFPLSSRYPRGTVTLGVRPEHLYVAKTGEGQIKGTVDVVEQLGESVLAYIKVGSETVVAKLERADALDIGTQLELGFSSKNAHFFSEDGKRSEAE